MFSQKYEMQYFWTEFLCTSHWKFENRDSSSPFNMFQAYSVTEHSTKSRTAINSERMKEQKWRLRVHHHHHDVPSEEPFSVCRRAVERSLNPTSALTHLTETLNAFASPVVFWHPTTSDINSTEWKGSPVDIEKLPETWQPVCITTECVHTC